MRLGRWLVLAAGFLLIVLGVGALIWSHALASGPQAAAHAWWQGTLQALGVGFAVGGVVDVLAIFGLNSVTGSEDRRRQSLNDGLREVLGLAARDSTVQVEAVARFIKRNNVLPADLDPDLRKSRVVAAAWARIAQGAVGHDVPPDP